ncbi:MAG: 3-hydroxyacyl-ACP dehydratase FabZ [Candidatus Adiutricales bacterium]
MSGPIDIEEIMRLLPHRFPFLLVDRVVSYEPNKTISAYKNVTYNEPYFQGHFPSRPVMPGVLILEAIAQTGGLLYMLSREESIEGQLFYFISADKVKFRKPVVPGDRLDFEISVLRIGSHTWKFQGVAFVDGAKAAEAVISAIAK